MKKLLILVPIIALVVVGVLVLAKDTPKDVATSEKPYYVALGDSVLRELVCRLPVIQAPAIGATSPILT